MLSHWRTRTWWIALGFLSLPLTRTEAADRPASRAAPGPDSTLLPVPPALQREIPPPRVREEVRAVLGKAQSASEPRGLHVVLVAGPKDHGPGEHDYPAWQKAWEKLLSKAPKTRVTTAWEKPGPDDFKTANVLVLFKHFAWPRELNEQVDAFLARGGGIVLLHFAVDAGDNGPSVGKDIGPYWGQGAKFRHGWLDLEFNEGKTAFLRGLAGRKLRFHDETYWNLTGDGSQNEVLATAVENEGNGQTRIPLLWNRQVGKGRVHVNILGHYNWTFNDPLFRILVLRGIAWAAGEPVDRFSELATVDVVMKE